MRKLRDAALTVFEKRGYHAARVDDIVKVAKTSHGTFYLYFANKEDLFRTLVARVAESAGAGGLDPQVAALAIVAMIERLNFYLLSGQLGIDRDEMLDTTASIIHVGLFGGTRMASAAGSGGRASAAGSGDRASVAGSGASRRRPSGRD